MMATTDERSPETGGQAEGPPLKVFTAEVIERMKERDEPMTASAADFAGPWRERPLGGGRYGVCRDGDGEYGIEPLVTVDGREFALLTAAALATLPLEGTYRVEPGDAGRGSILLRDGRRVGTVTHLLCEVASALDVLEAVVRSPSVLAQVLEAAGPTALERAGRELGLRLTRDRGASKR